jgi:UDP-N-acetylglucosamine acyltransferase
MMADGNPARVRHINQIGLERSDATPETMRAVKEAFRILYRSNLNTAQAVERLNDTAGDCPEIAHLIAFVATSTRGIIR